MVVLRGSMVVPWTCGDTMVYPWCFSGGSMTGPLCLHAFITDGFVVPPSCLRGGHVAAASIVRP